MIPIIIFLLSIGLQLAAAIYALFLIPLTGRKAAWLLISAAMVLMTGRRIVSFISILSAGRQISFDVPELIALVIACLMLVGVHGIRDYFLSSKRLYEEKEKLILDLQEALAKVKQLSGLLPICASCKKIRDDKGYWNQIETYISEHSEALFSHAICPECGKKLYPEYYDKVWGKEEI